MEDVAFSRFDAAEYLETEEDLAAFLEAASEDGNPDAIALALGAIARARNISQLARDTGLTRAGVYKALSPGGNPSFATILKIAQALNMHVKITPAAGRTETTAPVPT